MAKIRVKAGNITWEAEFAPPEKLSALLQRCGVAPGMPCGGGGRCGKCRVWAEGELSPLSDAEARHSLPAGERLACEAVALGSVSVVLPEAKGDRIRTDGAMASFARAEKRGIGFAFDIGTTTVAAYLYDLATGERLAVASVPNPQAAWGADVLSRMGASMRGEREALAGAIRGAMLSLRDQLLRDAGRENEGAEYVITGNTAMLYFLTGRDPASIASVPFAADTLFGCEWEMPNAGLVYLPRSVSAYVGADITCAMMAADFAGNRDRTCLLVDIGTNGEMALLHRGRLWVCSTAAGPAFEGAGIEMGMNARDGAITRVDCKENGLTCEWIGDEPRGICGSGIVDALAALLESGIVDESGRMADTGARYRDGVAYPIADGVYLTQKDVRQVQLAKAAICAGMLTLIEKAGLEPEDVPEVLIAGGFGSCIRPESAERIGLMPEGFAARARAIGNAAGAGACMLLLGMGEKQKAESLARDGRVLELSTDPFFMDAYVDCMAFPEEE